MEKRLRINDCFSAQDIKKLNKSSDLQGFMAVGTTWALILASLGMVAWFPNLGTGLIALVLLGGRHLALGILMHDASHYSLFKSRFLNDWVGSYLCAYPSGHDLARYRAHHMRHHQFAGTDKDPDQDLVTAYPTTRASLVRKFLRDLSGITALKRVYGIFLMDFGFIEYTVSSRVVIIPPEQRTLKSQLLSGYRHFLGKLMAQAVLLGVAIAIGKPWLYLLWVAAYFTTFSAFVRIRSIAEHACTSKGADPLKSTRTTIASVLARLTVAPHRVNYHLEHHLMMTLPSFRLPLLHERLKSMGLLKDAFVSPDYVDVLKQASSLT